MIAGRLASASRAREAAMESSDFAPVVESTAGAGFIDPIWLFIAAAAAVLLVVVGWVVGRGSLISEAEQHRRHACASIHKAILDRARAAAAATRPHVMSSATALFEEINLRLGPLASVGGTFGKDVKALSEALKGQARPPAPAAPAHAGGGHGDGHADPKPGDKPESAPAQVNIDVNVANGHAGGHGKAGEAAGDQIDAIRAAVLHFTDHWAQPETERQLHALQRALLTPAPKPVFKPSASH